MDLVINLNKPEGITSQEAVSRIKKILNEALAKNSAFIKTKKAGHTGTLDPFATGILLVCTGRATRLASYLSSIDKEYLTVMKLGEATDTQDLCGKVIETHKVDVTEDEIKNTLKSFEGRILQRPPMFSALKHRGVPLYKFARKGIDIPREPREVYIYKIEPLKINLPFVTFSTLCSKGTYLRTLCDDIGRKLGTGAHLFKLERTAIGQFKIDGSITFDELLQVRNESPRKTRGIYSMDEALGWMPEIKVKGSAIKNVKNGNPLRINDCYALPPNLKNGDSVRIKSPDGEFLAVGSLFEDLGDESFQHRYTVRMDVVLA